MQLTKRETSEKETALKAAYKRIEAREKKKMKLKTMKLPKCRPNNNVF